MVNAFFLGGCLAVLVSFPVFSAIALVGWSAPAERAAFTAAPEPAKPSKALADEFEGLRIASYGRLSGTVVYVFVDQSGNRITGDDLMVRDITVKDRGPREALLVRDADYLSVYR